MAGPLSLDGTPAGHRAASDLAFPWRQRSGVVGIGPDGQLHQGVTELATLPATWYGWARSFDDPMDRSVGVDFRILGPLEVLDDDRRRLDLGAPRQRAVLAVLLVSVDHVVSVDRLIDDLWGEAPPSAATASLQAYVSNLRRVLEPQRRPRTPARVVVTEAPGYALRIPVEQLDAARFERLATHAHRALVAGDAAAALRSCDAALGLWRGGALADFTYEPFAASEIARLDELRAGAEEDRVESRMMVGDDAGALAALRPLVAAHPLRERLRALQIQLLYRSGRQAEAVRAYEDARDGLHD